MVRIADGLNIRAQAGAYGLSGYRFRKLLRAEGSDYALYVRVKKALLDRGWALLRESEKQAEIERAREARA